MTYHRVLAIVPLVGSGTAADPKRPMFAPAPQSAAPTNPFGLQQSAPQSNAQATLQSNRQAGAPVGIQGNPRPTGIIAYQHQVSDDGTLALVEFVAVDRSAFAALFASTDPRVKYFEVGKTPMAQIEAAFKQRKASFSAASFFPMPVQ